LHVEERKLVIKVLDHKGYKPPNQVPDEQAGRVFTYKFGEVRFNDGWHWMESILTRAEQVGGGEIIGWRRLLVVVENEFRKG